MAYPKAYSPEKGYRYQILARMGGSREYDHVDYAKDREEKKFLLNEYRLAYRGMGAEFKVIELPMKYWK